MITKQRVEPVRKELLVQTSQQRAFETFTAQMDSWWPREHHIGKSPMKEFILECKSGGRWFSICEDGTRCDVGYVLTWEPYGKVVFAWQITATWQYDPNFVTEVELNFIQEGPKLTRVTLEHRNLELYGDMAPKLRDTLDSPEGWAGNLKRFAKVAETNQ